MNSRIWDAHAHWTSERLTAADLRSWRERSQREGIRGVILGGWGPEEWGRQAILFQESPDFYRMTYGLHPWWVSQASEAECEQGFIDLESRLSSPVEGLVGLGELGLDLHPRFSEEQRGRQHRIFLRQLELLLGLRKQGKALGGVFHFVRAHGPALQTLEALELPETPWGIVHSFSGDRVTARKYLRIGLIPSLSLGVLGRGEGKAFETLKRAVLELSLGQFVLETDAPDQPPKGQEVNHPGNLRLLAGWIAEWRAQGETADQILEASAKTLGQIFRLGS